MQLVAAAVGQGEWRVPLADARQLGREVGDPVDHDMHHLTLALDPARHGDHAGGEDDAAMLLEDLLPDDEIGDAGLVLEGDEHDAPRRSRSLAHQHDPGRLHPSPVAGRHGVGAGDDAALAQLGPQEGDRVAAQRQADMAVVLHHLGPGRHRPQGDRRLGCFGDGCAGTARRGREQGQLLAGQPLDRPEGVAAGKAERLVQAVGLGDAGQGRDRHAAAVPEIIDGRERVIAAGRDDRGGMGIGETLGQTQPEAHRAAAIVAGRLQRAIPSRRIDAERADLDAMVLCVPHDLGGGVEAHRLAVEQGGAEHVRMPALEPGAGVGDEREGGGMAFREAVGSEAFELLEGRFGKAGIVAVRDHALDELVAEPGDAARELERRHRLAQHVRLAGAEAGADDGDPHGLFLKERHAERLAQHLLQVRRRKIDRLPSFPAPEVGVHHIPLDRSRAHDGDLDDEIVIGARLEARQHRHLRPGLDLERPERICLADHRIGARILGRDRGEVDSDALVLSKEIEAAPHAAQHSERQHVDLHHLQGVDVVLVPLDHLTIGHAGRLDRHQVVQPVPRQDEAAGMLGEMAGCPVQLSGEIERQPQPAVSQGQAEVGDMLFADAVLRPGPDLAGDRPDEILGEPEGLAHVAQRALGAIADHRRAERGAVPAIGLIDPLDDLLPPLVLEIDVDVRGLVSFLAHETLEQEVVAGGVDRGDAEHVADCGIGR